VDDADGAGRVVQYRLADGAEHHSPYAAAAAGTHDEHLGVLRCLQQRGARRAVGDLLVDGYPGMPLFAVGDHLPEFFLEQVCAAQASASSLPGEPSYPTRIP